MKVNHLNHFVISSIYCERHRAVVLVGDGFMERECDGCPYFNGHLQGDGIECLYEDTPLRGGFVHIWDPNELYKRRMRAIGQAKLKKSMNHVISVDGEENE